MLRIVRTDSENKDFISLVQQLDADLAERDGNEHAFYAQFNSITHLKHAIVLYEADTAVACGAFKMQDETTVEVKRMYTLPASRGNGYAAKVLAALETWAKEAGFKRCVLETGKRQPEAIALYKKAGYKVIPNYGQYAGIENSVCFEKWLS